MEDIQRKINFDTSAKDKRSLQLVYDEFLVTNGLGGYSSASLGGATTRKYHGILVSSLPSPLGRTVMLNFIEDKFVTPEGDQITLSHQEFFQQGFFEIEALKEFRLENGLPVWTYVYKNYVIEKRIFMPYQQNTVHITYNYLEGPNKIEFSFEPFLNFRHHEASVATSPLDTYELTANQHGYEIRADSFPPLKISSTKKTTLLQEKSHLKDIMFRIEAERGYDAIGELYSGGKLVTTLEPKESITFVASSESWEVIQAIPTQEAYKIEQQRRRSLLAEAQHLHPNLMNKAALELVLAADQFIITPSSRAPDVAFTHALGDEPKTIIAGYHWFTDWGRDTMISLEGLTLIPGRIQEAEYILKTFAHHLREGLIPNMFPDGKNEGVYHTVDATLWFFHALDRYFAYSGDEELIKTLLPKIKDILNYHINGTRFGIQVDKTDGLLNQGQEGYALTWMDAKVENLVVTPRRGKAVEINALWYNALRLAIEWMEKFDPSFNTTELKKLAEQCYASFNHKFWYSKGGYLYDRIETELNGDAACRPNQLLAISLKYPILKKENWESVVEVTRKELLTKLGLRTLSSEHPDYKITYSGNLFLRDSAYHQGTVWAWLIGPYVDAWIKTYPGKKDGLDKLLENFDQHMNEGCIGTISEIFDASEPFAHRGCVAQAWSVAEVLRVWIKLSNGPFHPL